MVASPTTRSAHPSGLWPGIKAHFGDKYTAHPRFYTRMFDVVDSAMSKEEYVEDTGMGIAAEKREGAPITYDGTLEGNKQTIANKSYGLGAMISREAIDDDLYEQRALPSAEKLAMAMVYAEETISAAVYNRAFNASYSLADGKPVLATDHPTIAGNQSNKLSVAADFSETSVEALSIQILKAKNRRGNRIALQKGLYILPPDLEFEAERLFGTDKRVGTENNDINALKANGDLSGGYMCNPYLTDTDAWFVRTIVPTGQGMIFQDRVAAELEQDNEFTTKNACMSVYRRFGVGVADWQSLYGSEGA